MILTFATDSAVHHPPSEPPLFPILRYNPWLGWGEGEEKKYLTGVKIRGSKSRTMVALSQSTCVLLHVSSTFFSSLSLNRQVLSSVAYFPQGQERRPAFSAMVRSSERLPPRLQNQVIQESLWGMILNCQSRAVSLFSDSLSQHVVSSFLQNTCAQRTLVSNCLLLLGCNFWSTMARSEEGFSNPSILSCLQEDTYLYLYWKIKKIIFED